MKDQWQYKEGNIGVALAQKGATNGGIKVGGYASLWGVRDGHGDVTVKGAFADSISARPQPPLLWAHKADLLPVGRIDWLREDRRGLLFSATVQPTTMGKDIKLLLKSGSLSGVSYGYTAEKHEAMKVDGEPTRALKRISLFEVSLVNFPSLEDARISSLGAKVAPMLQDALLVGEVKHLEERGQQVPNHKMVAYCDAFRREGERMQYNGLTATMWAMKQAATARDFRELAEGLENLEAQAAELERSQVVEEDPRRRRKRQLWQLQRDIAAIGGDPDSIKI